MLSVFEKRVDLLLDKEKRGDEDRGIQGEDFLYPWCEEDEEEEDKEQEGWNRVGLVTVSTMVSLHC